MAILGVVLAACAPGANASRIAHRCRLAGTWAQWTHDVGLSRWTVAGDGRARERGVGHAAGHARFVGRRVLRIDWNIADGVGGVPWSGFYSWRLVDCDNGRGWLTYTRGPRAGEIHPSSVVRTG